MLIDWACYHLILMAPLYVERKLFNFRFYGWMIGRAGNWAYR